MVNVLVYRNLIQHPTTTYIKICNRLVSSKSLQRVGAADEHVQVVVGGDGAGQVPLRHVQLLDVPRDLLHHLLTLLRPLLDGPDLVEQLPDRLLRLRESLLARLERLDVFLNLILAFILLL